MNRKIKHGTVSRYRAGCSCETCTQRYQEFRKEANAKAKAKRAEKFGEMVPAGGTRFHLQQLSKCGVGRRAVSDACDVPPRTIYMIRTGRWKRIRLSLAVRICSVTKEARADGSRISAERCWGRIERLKGQGFTQQEIARRLGYRGNKPKLRLSRARVTARNALRVLKLYQGIMATT